MAGQEKEQVITRCWEDIEDATKDEFQKQVSVAMKQIIDLTNQLAAAKAKFAKLDYKPPTRPDFELIDL